MLKRKTVGSPDWTDPDDAPELTDDMVASVERFEGDTFIQRGPGRPRSNAPKEQISIRLDADLVAKLRATGPGWQSQINVLLRQALALEDAATSYAA